MLTANLSQGGFNEETAGPLPFIQVCDLRLQSSPLPFHRINYECQNFKELSYANLKDPHPVDFDDRALSKLSHCLLHSCNEKRKPLLICIHFLLCEYWTPNPRVIP
jgi:hypothetical protein